MYALVGNDYDLRQTLQTTRYICIKKKRKKRKKKRDTFIKEWARAHFTTSVFNLPYSSMSFLVTTNFARRKAKEASKARVGALSTTRLDEGTSVGSMTSTYVAGTWTTRMDSGTTKGQTTTSSDASFEAESPRRFLSRLTGTTSFCSIILFNFSLFSLAMTIPTTRNKEKCFQNRSNQNIHK